MATQLHETSASQQERHDGVGLWVMLLAVGAPTLVALGVRSSGLLEPTEAAVGVQVQWPDALPTFAAQVGAATPVMLTHAVLAGIWSGAASHWLGGVGLVVWVWALLRLSSEHRRLK